MPHVTNFPKSDFDRGYGAGYHAAKAEESAPSASTNSDYAAAQIAVWLGRHGIIDKVTCDDITWLVERLNSGKPNCA